MKEQKDKSGKWKVIAIIFIILFIVENVWITWGIILINQEEQQQKECFYDVCSEYPDAEFLDGVCFCYEYDLLGRLTVGKSEIMP